MEASPPRGPSKAPAGTQTRHSAGTAVAIKRTRGFATGNPKRTPPKSSGFRRSVKTGLAAGAADVRVVSPQPALMTRVSGKTFVLLLVSVAWLSMVLSLMQGRLTSSRRAVSDGKGNGIQRRHCAPSEKSSSAGSSKCTSAPMSFGLLALEAEKQERKARLAMRSKLHKLLIDTEENEEEKELSDQLWQFERDSQIEEITVLKMQGGFAYEARKMEMLSDRSIVQVEAIEDVLISRGTGDYEKLQQILNKADTLKASMLKGDLEGHCSQTQTGGIRPRVVEEQKADGARDDDMFRLADEVQVAAKQREKGARGAEVGCSTSSARRSRMHNSIKSGRKDHRIMMEKGLDFLVDVELGKAPPIDVILANARNGENRARALI